MSLEQALEFIADDECVEVTPHNVRLRKVVLDGTTRGRAVARPSADVERPAVDLHAAADFLSHRFAGRATDVAAAPRQGEWSRAYFFRHDDADLVVRFALMADNFEKDSAVARYTFARPADPAGCRDRRG